MVYHLDVTCTKGPGGGSFWLPQVGTTFGFSPARGEANPDPGWVTVASNHQSPAGACNIIFHVPSRTCAASQFPLRLSCETSSPARLTSLRIQLLGRSLTRARNFLFGEKVAEDRTELMLANLQSLDVWLSLNPPALSECGLSLEVPRALTPCFSSFNICQESYVI